MLAGGTETTPYISRDDPPKVGKEIFRQRRAKGHCLLFYKWGKAGSMHSFLPRFVRRNSNTVCCSV
jgi:hypothetical protein